MSDFAANQKPMLTLEEELDVLEAVYRVGKEKGLDLLRPEQLKKLLESGRTNDHENDDDGKKPSSMDSVHLKNVIPTLDLVIEGLVLQAQSDAEKAVPPTEWKNMNDQEKRRVAMVVFLSQYSCGPEDLRAWLLTSLGGETK